MFVIGGDEVLSNGNGLRQINGQPQRSITGHAISLRLETLCEVDDDTVRVMVEKLAQFGVKHRGSHGLRGFSGSEGLFVVVVQCLVDPYSLRIVQYTVIAISFRDAIVQRPQHRLRYPR